MGKAKVKVKPKGGQGKSQAKTQGKTQKKVYKPKVMIVSHTHINVKKK